MFPAVSVCSVSRKCCTISFFGRFLESCHIAHPRSYGKVLKKLVRGCEIGEKPYFGRKNVARFEIYSENRNRATKFVGSFRGFLSLGRFSRHGVRHKLGVWAVEWEAWWRGIVCGGSG